MASFDAEPDFGLLLDKPALLTIWHGLISSLTQSDTSFAAPATAPWLSPRWLAPGCVPTRGFVANDRSEEVVQNEDLNVGEDRNRSVGGNGKTHIEENRDENMLGTSTQTVGLAKTLNFGGLLNVMEGLNSSEQVTLNKQLNVGQQLHITATDNISVTNRSGEVRIDSSTSLILSCGGAYLPLTYIALCLINKGSYQFYGVYVASSLAGSIPLSYQTFGTICGLKCDFKSPPDYVQLYVQIGLAMVKASVPEDRRVPRKAITPRKAVR